MCFTMLVLYMEQYYWCSEIICASNLLSHELVAFMNLLHFNILILGTCNFSERYLKVRRRREKISRGKRSIWRERREKWWCGCLRLRRRPRKQRKVEDSFSYPVTENGGISNDLLVHYKWIAALCWWLLYIAQICRCSWTGLWGWRRRDER